MKDIPLLGTLFSSTSNSKERKELIVLMRPTVLATPEIAAAATIEEKRRLPGISSAEEEGDAAEAKRLKKAEKKSAKDPFKQ